MKTVLYFSGIVMVLLAVSCTGMNDNIEEYLNRGEIDYLGRPDSASTQAGFERVRIAWFVNEDPRITGSVITWNDRKNEPQSTSFPIDRGALVNGYTSVILPLEEGTYVFRIEHTGDKGFTSIATEVSGRVFGAGYVSTLPPRSIDAVTVYPDRVEIDWASAEASVTKVLLTYETASGAEKTVEVAPSEGRIVLTDNKLQGKYFWVTRIQEEGVLDELSASSDEKVFPSFKRGQWWLFDNSADFGHAASGQDLTLVGAGFTAAAGPLGSNVVRVAKGSYFLANHGFEANRGGEKVNEYTIMFDYRLPELNKWYCFLQTNPANSDDGEIFIRPSGTLTNSNIGYSEAMVPQDDNWHRLVISCKLPEFCKFYIDGNLFFEGKQTALALDNRYALDIAGVAFCADNDGEDSDMDIAGIAIWNVALTADQAKIEP